MLGVILRQFDNWGCDLRVPQHLDEAVPRSAAVPIGLLPVIILMSEDVEDALAVEAEYILDESPQCSRHPIDADSPLQIVLREVTESL